MLLAAFRIALALFAVLLIAGGVVLMISPFPFGFVLIFVGFFLLVAVAPSFIRWIRRHWRWFDRQMHRLENFLPNWLARPFRATDYDHDAEEKKQGRKRKKR